MPLILILDDRATNRAIFARLAALTAEEVVVESFANPLDALEWLGDNTVDLVITDYKMPEMDGAEFTRQLRALPRGAEVPVLVVTAHDDRSFRQTAMEAGATDFLQSPVDHFEFVARARNLLALPRREAGCETVPATRAEPLTVPAMDDLPALVSATDRDGRCLFVNARQAQRASIAPAEAIGQDIGRILGAERAALSRAKDRLVLETGRRLPTYVEATEGDRLLVTAKAPLRAADGSLLGVLSTSIEVDRAAVAELDPKAVRDAEVGA